MCGWDNWGPTYKKLPQVLKEKYFNAQCTWGYNMRLFTGNRLVVVKNLKLSALFCLSLLTFGTSNAKDSISQKVRYTPTMEASLKAGNIRHIGRMGIVIPLFQQPDVVTYFTGIGMRDTKKAFEGNFGFGARKIIGEHIYGLYGYYDIRKTINDNVVHGSTIGVELLHSDYEARVNVYLPDESIKKKAITHKKNKRANFVNIRPSKQELHETALKGIDIEVGGNHPGFDKLQGFIAYYYFAGKNTSTTVNGIRLRGDFKIFDWASLEAEISHDKQRKTMFYGGLKLNYTFDMKSTNMNRLQQKMTQLPVRDIDVVTVDEIKTIYDDINTVGMMRRMAEEAERERIRQAALARFEAEREREIARIEAERERERARIEAERERERARIEAERIRQAALARIEAERIRQAALARFEAERARIEAERIRIILDLM